MDNVYKILENCEVKKVGERQYEFTASTSTQDRDGEVIDATGWDLKNFKKNPVIMYAHDYRSLPIGKASRVWLHNGSLKNTVEFPPEGTYEFADIVERLVDTGYLKTESVGFIPKKWEDGDGEKAPRRTYTKQELLEISIVPVPSNPDALRNAVEDGVITTKQFEAITNEPDKIITNPYLTEEAIESLKDSEYIYVTKPEVEIYTDDGILDERTNIKTTPITKPEETDEFIRIPVRDCKVTATIDISKKEGISALYCGKEKQVKTYLFRKDKDWTMAKAKAWVKEHEKKTYKPHEVSQSEIIDEIDYLKSLVEKEGLSDIAKDASNNLLIMLLYHLGYDAWKAFKVKEGEIVEVGFNAERVSGYDNPVDIEEDITTQESLTLLSEIIKEQMEVK